MDTKTLCLGVLTMGSASGYDIKKQIVDIFGNFMDVSSSSVYPALKLLLKDDFVSCEVIIQESKPSKKVYSLTDKGALTFKSSLKDLQPRHKVRSQFLMLLFFAELLTSEKLQNVIEERVQELKYWKQETLNWLEEEEGKNASIGQAFITDYALSTINSELNYLQTKAKKFIVKHKASDSTAVAGEM